MFDHIIGKYVVSFYKSFDYLLKIKSFMKQNCKNEQIQKCQLFIHFVQKWSKLTEMFIKNIGIFNFLYIHIRQYFCTNF